MLYALAMLCFTGALLMACITTFDILIALDKKKK